MPGNSFDCFFKCDNERRDVVNEVQLRLAWDGINSCNVVHSDVVHTMGISGINQVLKHVHLQWFSGPFVWILQFYTDRIVLAFLV